MPQARSIQDDQMIRTNNCQGAITTLLTNPIWVVKTRMLTTSSSSTPLTDSHAATPGDAYSSIIASGRTIYHKEGIAGFYRGLLPASFGVIHGALQFMTYEKLKLVLRERKSTRGHQQSNTQLNALDIAVASGLSRIFAGGLTYPYQVLRSRMQLGDSQGFISLTQRMWKKEGIISFYRGMGPGLFRVLPSTWLTFLTYEEVKKALGGADYI
ncbi:mitochondrial folate carrier protein Flx1 [Penicillium malachiteum]|uniref:mitochondrial folate carrier protein Flx1 n=1 Tax=Penicillium malachiteum TaxID=1324776 RepID=UPI0025491BAF|nr:mitochondrial folate carrier protein Flx1 [Penicillium malachiteum]KAJ5737872.1 mitochondrial folate carrier protein Flx1 [Penicillium malachiteum]